MESKEQHNSRKGMVPAKQAKGPSKSSRKSRKATRATKDSLSKEARVRIRNSEYIMDIDSPATVSRYINPGCDETFPWLSRIARNYEYYTFKSLRFRYVPTAQLVEGNIVMAVDYDANDVAPLDKRTLFAYQGAMRTMVSKPSTLNCPKANLRAVVKRAVDTVSAANPRLCHLGTFIYQAAGSFANTVGEIWVDYEVDLFIPQLTSRRSPEGSGLSANPMDVDKLFSNPTVLGPDPLTVVEGGIGTKNAGDYLIQMTMEGAGLKSPPNLNMVGGRASIVEALIDGQFQRGMFSILVQAVGAWMLGMDMKSKATSVNRVRASVAPYFTAY